MDMREVKEILKDGKLIKKLHLNLYILILFIKFKRKKRKLINYDRNNI
jgi:hypothetical protein